MNICMFTNTYLPLVGGVSRSVLFFTEDLRRMGHRVLVVAPAFPGYDGKSVREPDVVRVPAIQNFNGSDFSVRIPVPFFLDQEIEKFAPDLVHSHHPFLMGDAAIRAARKRSLPLVYTHHTRFEQYTHYVPIDSEALKDFVVELATQYANLSSRVVAPSASIAALLKENGVQRPIEEIPTGVDIPFFAAGDGEKFRRAAGLPAGAFVIGHVGRLAPEKNLGYLAEAVALYLETDATARFLVAGKGPSTAEIERIFEERGLADRLHMAGEVTGKGLGDAFKAMDLFVFSSKSETQGMVLVEAMAAGKPVIALDASGSREVIRNGENGRLLPPDAPVEDFAAAIEGFRADADLARDWTAAAGRTAESFSREACAEKLESLYNETLKGHSARMTNEENNGQLGPLDAVAERIRAEWELLSLKTAAAVEALKPESD